MDDTARQCRILVVDDHADTRDLLVRLLSRIYHIKTADSYESGLAAATAQPPDVVIADISLPGPSGLELMQALHERYHVPGIAVTGHAIDPAAFRAAGFVQWLRKPIQFDELLRALH